MRLEGGLEGPGLARLLAEAGRCAYFCCRPADEVLSLCQRAIELADHIGDLVAKADASINIALSLSTSDYKKAFQILQDVIVMTEANGLWVQASRAHSNLGALSENNLDNLETAYKNVLRSIEISAQMGRIESVLLQLGGLVSLARDLGQLRTIEATALNILSSCSVSPARVAEFVNRMQAELSLFRGEWALTLESFRLAAVTLRLSSNFQSAALINLFIVMTTLELNRFMGLADLSEAEAALRGNIELSNWLPLWTSYFRVILTSRQKRFTQARQLLGA